MLGETESTESSGRCSELSKISSNSSSASNNRLKYPLRSQSVPPLTNIEESPDKITYHNTITRCKRNRNSSEKRESEKQSNDQVPSPPPRSRHNINSIHPDLLTLTPQQKLPDSNLTTAQAEIHKTLDYDEDVCLEYDSSQFQDKIHLENYEDEDNMNRTCIPCEEEDNIRRTSIPGEEEDNIGRTSIPFEEEDNIRRTSIPGEDNFRRASIPEVEESDTVDGDSKTAESLIREIETLRLLKSFSRNFTIDDATMIDCTSDQPFVCRAGEEVGSFFFIKFGLSTCRILVPNLR